MNAQSHTEHFSQIDIQLRTRTKQYKRITKHA